ncbi:hypothetical protein RCH08_003469 [Janthinobacterium sp. CG_S6]|nr:hypothetical protein [Janthinobacterium sp. CG_S6]
MSAPPRGQQREYADAMLAGSGHGLEADDGDVGVRN